MELRKTKFYKSMTPYLACAIAEGFCEGENASEKEVLSAWQWLSDTGRCWQLQGFYGRTVVQLLKAGEIKPALKDRTDFYGHTIKAGAIPA